MFIIIINGIILLTLFSCYKFLHTFYGSVQLFIVLQLTYFVLFLKCINKMVDIISNKIYETYCRFSPSNTQPKDSLVSLTSLKRYENDQKRRKQQYRESDTKVKDAHLFRLKTNQPEVLISQKRPFMGLCCKDCTYTSRGSLIKKSADDLALQDILRYEIPLSKNGLLSRTFSHLHQIFQLKQYKYPQVAHLILKEDRVKKAIEKSSLQQFRDTDNSDDEYYQRLIKTNEKRAKKIINDMKSTLSDFLLRFTSWILYKLLPCFLNSVVAHPGQVEMLKTASKSNLPMIFLPLHRSHLDYILISFILLNNNIRAPLVAAGDNLRLPFFGSLLRGLGAFFIKRRIDPVKGRKDYVYKAVLHTYMNLCLKQGHNIEFFLEGGRTRTGKPLMPKYGILSVIVDSFMDGTIDDALIVPVSVNYERLVDGNFVSEQLGESKEMETFTSALKGIWHVLNSNYGTMRIDFNQPFSLRELIATFNTNKKNTTTKNFNRILKSNPSTNSLYGTDIVSDEHKSLVENISKHVIYDCSQSTSIMSTNALAFLLLTKYRNGITLEKLVVALDDLIKELNYSGRDVGFTGDPVDVINYAIDIFGPALIKKEKQKDGQFMITPISILPNVIELTYYSNIVVTHFAMESVISLAISISDITLDTIQYDQLIENIMELCDILQYEFLFCKPCQLLDEVIVNSIDDISMRKDLFITEEKSVLAQRSRKLAEQFDNDNDDDDDDDVGRSFEKSYKLNMSIESLNNIRYLRSILMPLIETYAITAFTLDKLVQRQLLESELINEVLIEMKGQLERGSIKYDESIAVDSIKNAIKLYQKWEVLECHNEDKLRIYYLKDTYDDSEIVNQIYKRINKYRQFSLE